MANIFMGPANFCKKQVIKCHVFLRIFSRADSHSSCG